MLRLTVSLSDRRKFEEDEKNLSLTSPFLVIHPSNPLNFYVRGLKILSFPVPSISLLPRFGNLFQIPPLLRQPPLIPLKLDLGVRFWFGGFLMKIEYLEDQASDGDDEVFDSQIAKADAKRALVGAGARILFYPTLLYNVVRNKIESEFRWWDEIDQFLLLGAVPFPKDVPRLKQLGVGGVITLNESYETLVPSSLYHSHGIDHLTIPTRDYCFAPKFADISRAVDFIHKNASCGKTTYVHCKAGRGRSTTIVLCYLVKYKDMTPVGALDYVRSRRPRVLLAPSQWEAVQEYSNRLPATGAYSPSRDAVLVTKADLDGYYANGTEVSGKELALVSKMAKTKPMIAKLSCLFASLKVNGSSSVARRMPVPEARAC